MSVIKWRDSFNVGVESMDEQHKTIVELINKLFNVIREEQPEDSILPILEEMTAYAEKHFQEEESFLEANDYPDLTNHVAMHKEYRDKLNSLQKDLKDKKDSAALAMYSFLRQWWTDHIMTEDKKYGETIDS